MKRWFLPILAIAVPVAVLVAGRVQAAASPAAASATSSTSSTPPIAELRVASSIATMFTVRR